MSALEGKIGTVRSILPYNPATGLESRVSELESSVSALNRSTGTGRFSGGSFGSLESRVSDLEYKVGGRYLGSGLGSGLSDLEQRVSALERGSRGY
ncbi:MAG: hypothetical protein Q8P22_01390 [Chloroflexota bacterium]|nr:hypothetical protein [Chloroflexota bacterium]